MAIISHLEDYVNTFHKLLKRPETEFVDMTQRREQAVNRMGLFQTAEDPLPA